MKVKKDPDFFTRDGKSLYLTFMIIAEEIGEEKEKHFAHFNTEESVITEIANISNSNSLRVHKILIINQEGEVRELSIGMITGKLRLTVKEGEADGV